MTDRCMEGVGVGFTEGGAVITEGEVVSALPVLADREAWRLGQKVSGARRGTGLGSGGLSDCAAPGEQLS